MATVSNLSDGGSRCNWGAIFCGVFLTLACIASAFLIANGIRLSPLDAIDPRVSDGHKIAAWIYTFGTCIVSFFFGGMFCTRIGRVSTERDGAIYGLANWAVSGVAIMILGVTGSMIFNLMLTGDGPQAGNWLLIAIALLGAPASAFGGRMGSRLKVVRAPVEATRPQIAEGPDQGVRAA